MSTRKIAVNCLLSNDGSDINWMMMVVGRMMRMRNGGEFQLEKKRCLFVLM